MNREMNLTIILNYVYIIITNLSSIILTPIIISGLGMEQYGLYTLVYSTVLYLMVNEFSIGNIVISNLAKYREMKDKKAEESFLFYTLLVFVLLGIIAVAACTFINLNASLIFQKTFSGALLSEFRRLFTIMTATAFLQFFQVFFFSILAGLQKFLYARIILVVRVILRLIFIFAFMKGGFGAEAIFLIDFAFSLLTTVFYAAYVLGVLKITIKRHKDVKVSHKSLFRHTMSLYTYYVFDNVYWNVGNLIVAATHGAEVVSIFSIFITFCSIFIQIASVVPVYFMPGISKLIVAKASNSDLTDLMIKMGRLIVAALTLVSIGFAFAGKDLIKIWIGEEFLPAFSSTLIVFVAMIFPQGQLMGDIIIQAENKFGVRTLINAASTLTCIGVSYWFISRYALKYAFMGLLVTGILYKFIANGIYYLKCGLDMKRYSKSVYLKMFAVAALTVILCLPLSLIQSSGIIFILLKIAYICLIFSFSSYFIYFNRQEKDVVISALKKLMLLVKKS